MYKYGLALIAALGTSAPAWAGGGISFGCVGGHVSFSCYGGTVAHGCYGGDWQPVAHGCYGGGWQPVGHGGGWRSVGYGCNGGGWRSVGYGCAGSACVGSGWRPVGHGCVGAGFGSYAVSDRPVMPGERAGPAPRAMPEQLRAAPKPNGSETPRYGDGSYYEEERRPNRRQDKPAAAEEPQRNRPTTNGSRPPANGPAPENVGPPEEEARGPAAATILVALPEDAKLSVNNKATQSNSAVRKFVTTPLEPGKDFHYTLKANFARDGQTFTASKRVAVRAGEEKQVTLEFTTAGLAQE